MNEKPSAYAKHGVTSTIGSQPLNPKTQILKGRKKKLFRTKLRTSYHNPASTRAM